LGNSQILILSLLVLVSGFYFSDAFGQSSIVVTTDKASYSEGETVRITGEVSQLLGGYALAVTVLHPDGSLVSIDQITVGYDKKFSTSLAAGGATMDVAGTYTVIAQYGDNKNNYATTSFEFGGPMTTITTGTVNLSSPGCEETNECYTPGTATVVVGSVVTMTNTDSTGIHTFTSGTVDGFAPSPDGIFDSGMLMKPGDSFEYIADTAGEFPYYCTLHVWMQGTIIVQEAEAEEPKITPKISVSTNRASYENADTVVFSGKITNYDSSSGKGLTFLVKSPNYDDVVIGQVTPSYDGSFSKSFVAGGPLWELSGNYVIEVHYGSASAQTSLYYSNPTQPTPYPTPQKGVLSMTLEKSFYGIYESFTFIGTQDGNSVVFVIIRDASGSFKGMLSDPREIQGEFSTIPRPVTNFFSNHGIYTATAFTDDQKEEDGFTIKLEFDGSKLTSEISDEPDPSPTRDTTPPKILKPTDITVDAENNRGANVTYDVLAIDETDQLVRPSCYPSSGSFFEVGETRIICNAMDSSGNRAQSISFSVTVNPPELAIPDWIKNIAEFWCDDKIDDSSFIEGIQYLIDNNIIIVSATQSGYGGSQEIPNWVKNNACWWSEGLISDKDFASGIEFLVREGIIRV